MTLAEARERIWRRGARRYAAPSRAELAAMEGLIAEAARLAESEEFDAAALAEPLAETGFVAERWEVGDARVLALLDAPGRGGGAYLFRLGATARGTHARHVLQAPHAYHDVGTGRIAASLFFAHGAGDAFFTNTVHRYWAEDGTTTPRLDAPADVCRHDDSFFQAATRALLAQGPARLVQLHGFGDREGGDLDVVVSRGDERGSGAGIAALAARLGAVSGARVARFPEDTAELGATTNAQGRHARSVGAEFVHLEMSRSFRERLARERPLAAGLARVIWDAVR